MNSPDSRFNLLVSGDLNDCTLYRIKPWGENQDMLRGTYYHRLAYIKTPNLVDNHYDQIEEMAKRGARREIRVTTSLGARLIEWGSGILLPDTATSVRDFLELGDIVWEGQLNDTIIKYNDAKYGKHPEYSRNKMLESGYKFQ